MWFRCLRFSVAAWCKEAPNGGSFLCFSRESPPRAHPDRRPDLCYGFCRPAGLRSPDFHFGHSRLAPGGCRVAPRPRKKVMIILPSDCAPSLFLIPLAVPSFPRQPGSVGRSPGSIRGLGIFVEFALPGVSAQPRPHNCFFVISSPLELFIGGAAESRLTQLHTTRRHPR